MECDTERGGRGSGRDNMCEKSERGRWLKNTSEICGVGYSDANGSHGVELGVQLRRILVPSRDAFVDLEHHRGVRCNPHQMCTESAVQRSCPLSDHKTEGLDKSGVFFDTVDHRLSKPCPKHIMGGIP